MFCVGLVRGECDGSAFGSFWRPHGVIHLGVIGCLVEVADNFADVGGGDDDGGE